MLFGSQCIALGERCGVFLFFLVRGDAGEVSNRSFQFQELESKYMYNKCNFLFH